MHRQRRFRPAVPYNRPVALASESVLFEARCKLLPHVRELTGLRSISWLFSTALIPARDKSLSAMFRSTVIREILVPLLIGA